MTAIAFLARCALALTLLAGPAAGQQASDTLAPEGPGGGEARTGAVHAENRMVVTANPLATRAGLDMLERGGTAADALVAAQAVLGLVEPQSSGLGGGAFLLWYDGESGELTSLDGRETAPAAAGPDLFIGEDGAPLGFFEAVVGGRSVGVPGVPHLLEAIHERAGRLDWPDLFERAITLAEDGFEVSPRLHALIAGDAERLSGQAATRAYFLDADGAPLAAGTRLANPEYAETLRLFAEDAGAAFRDGPLAEAIVAAVTGHRDNPGELALDDLAGYEIVEREPVCARYRAFDICGMGPPSSGGIAVGQILGMLDRHDLATPGPDDAQSWRLIGDATRLAFADRERYVADTDFVSMPQGMLDAAYLDARGRPLEGERALPQDEVVAGEPPWERTQMRRDGLNLEQPATSHIVVADADGNVASMTSSVENAFGARVMAGGFLLNNQLTDFSFLAERDGMAVANRVAGGKRPRSSMSPTIVLRDDKPVHALGSPGGANIIVYVAKTLVALIDWEMDMQDAVALPHLVNRFGTYELEAGTDAVALDPDLAALGYDTAISTLNSGLAGISFTPDGLVGGADPRREGLAAGD